MGVVLDGSVHDGRAGGVGREARAGVVDARAREVGVDHQPPTQVGLVQPCAEGRVEVLRRGRHGGLRGLGRGRRARAVEELHSKVVLIVLRVRRNRRLDVPRRAARGVRVPRRAVR